MRNVAITNPALSPGAILGNETNPMRGLVFENVVVTRSEKPFFGAWPWNHTYLSTFAEGTCVGTCDPLPDGFAAPEAETRAVVERAAAARVAEERAAAAAAAATEAWRPRGTDLGTCCTCGTGTCNCYCPTCALDCCAC